MNYRRAQFIKSIVFSRSPYTILAEADSSEYVLVGEGPHVRVTRAGVSCIVPWSNIAAVELMPQEPAKAVVVQMPGRNIEAKGGKR